MPPYVYPLPSTTLLTFSSIFIDPAGTHTTVLADATSARTRLHLALKAVADNEPGASALAVVEAVQIYLPYLRGIVAALDADRLLYKNDPAFYWRSPLTHYTMSAPLLPLPSIHCEHLFVLVTYVLALSNYAAAILASLPKFEPKQGESRHMSTEDEKRTTAGLARSVDLLCQAAGVAEWSSENVLPSLDSVRTTSGGRAGKHKWPIEAGPEAFRGLAMTLLADAHVTAIRKLLLPVLPHALFSPPGPPLPSNHPSPALLSKLYLHVAKLYESSRALFRAHATESSSGSGSRRLFRGEKMEEPDSAEGELNAGFKRYLKKEAMLSQALAHKWLGVDAGENGKGARIGEAIAWCKDAQGRLELMEDSAVRERMKGLGIGKSNDRKKEERKARKGRVERDLEDVAAWVKTYTRQNDTVSFQPVPGVDTLTSPSGRPIFAAKAFTPPAPPAAFGSPTDEADAEDQAEAPADTANYAGKGTYF